MHNQLLQIIKLLMIIQGESIQKAPEGGLRNYAINMLRKQNIIQILKSSTPCERSDKDVKLLIDLIKYEPYFEPIAKRYKVLDEICKVIEYKKIKEGQFAYRNNTTSDCYYVLIKGQINLTITDFHDDVEEENQEKFEDNEEGEENFDIMATFTTSFNNLRMSKRQSMFSSGLSPQSQKQISIDNIVLEKKEMSSPQDLIKKIITIEDRIVRIVKPGQCFGEYMGDVNRRFTNAIATDDSHLIVIKKQFYQIISKAQLKSQNRIKYEFLKSVPLFKNVHRYMLESFIYLINEVPCIYNSKLFDEKQKIQTIFIIREGEFVLTKNVKVAKKISNNNMIEKMSFSKNAPEIQKKIAIRNVHIGQIFGDLEVFNKRKQFEENCVCKSQKGIIYSMNKNKFFNKIISIDNNLDEIQKFFTQKLERKIFLNNNFFNKFLKQEKIQNFLHGPSQKYRSKRVESAMKAHQKDRLQLLKRQSLDEGNFFKKFNRTISSYYPNNNRRISVRRYNKSYQKNNSLELLNKTSTMLKLQNESQIPNGIKDIVSLVQQKSSYAELRKSKHQNLFKVDLSKVPRYVKKKYSGLFKKKL